MTTSPAKKSPAIQDRLRSKGKLIDKLDYNDIGALQRYLRDHGDIDYLGTQMPPPKAVEGTYQSDDGQTIKVPPLSDEDRRTLVRWIDLGCPIDLDPQYNPNDPASRSFGWMCDDQRPTVAITLPAPGQNAQLNRVLIGMCDAYTGLDLDSFQVTADIPLESIPAGQNLASRFRPKSPGVWEMLLSEPAKPIDQSHLIVSIKDRQGNLTRIDRTFSVSRSQSQEK